MDGASSDALERARRVRLMIFDVDGVLTDGRLWYGPGGEELKAFHSFDGHGMKMLARSGVATALLSGRSSRAASLRAAELGVAHVLQGIEDKLAAFEALLARLGLQAAAAGFMGDELVDLPVLRRCGFACAPREAPELVHRYVHYRAETAAGAGAVREVCELIMQAQGTLDEIRAPYLQ
ncbi:MAG TPA: phenylphosphate carboxylase subunit delta [Burkholderiales bacterium]|nr:phenylphosphate carboxylase subunit delta [Burkholderiales bacterium]